MKFFLCISFLWSTIVIGQGQSPDQFLEYPLGSYFSRHHQVVSYFQHLEQAYPTQMKLEEYGRTNENRELMLAFISTKENLDRLEEIKKNHSNLENEKVALIWLSYNVHGNESSGTEAAMLTAYELLSASSISLENVIVIIDPCLNPDGRDRYVNWYNQQNSSLLNPNQSTAEHNEPWPGGRVNHYLFDLNRDWAWLTQIESQNRMAVYNEWQPHVHVDFHEQGINSPYYFAPAAEPMHDVITEWQKSYQIELGRNHAKYFDKNGWLYFTREEFDLLYPSYGDTYPTFTGAIGMTYEQGGSTSAGLGVINREGDTLRLIDRIMHHHTTGISTVELASKKYAELISEFQKFGVESNLKYKTFAVTGDKEKMNALVHLLELHAINYSIANEGNISGFDFEKNKNGSVKLNNSWILINTNQRKGKLVHVLFEPKTKLNDSLTYDITAWSLPYAYGLQCIASESSITGKVDQYDIPIGHRSGESQYAYLIRWNSMSDAKLLSRLLQEGVKVRYAEEEFKFGPEHYGRGTLIVINAENAGHDIDGLIPSLCNEFAIDYGTCNTGMVDAGKDFGSGSVKLINKQSIAVLSGEGCSPNHVGEIWHFFENELKYPLSRINIDDLRSSTLEDIDVLILPEGWYKTPTDLLKDFVNRGGTIIGIGNGIRSAIEGELVEKEGEEEEETIDEDYEHKTYSQKDREYVNEEISGAIYKCKVDNTHPLAFGYGDNYFTLKIGSDAVELMKEGDNVVFLEKDAVQVAGFVGSKAKAIQSESLIFGAESMGRGTQIYMIDNPLFRGFWENGKLFFVNALFFAGN